MTAALAHRGPNAEGLQAWRGAAIGHRRLSIIDLVTGDQPIFSEDGRKAVVLNGEIYNCQRLRVLLEAHGHRFATRSDTEVIVHAYEEYGVGCVERLEGMFAFALWDDKERRLLLARDRVGKKPLYYAQDGERLLFASELKALLQDGSIKRTVSLEALDGYLSLGAVQAPATILQGIAQIPPAHYLVWQDGNSRVGEYWDVPRGGVVERSEGQAIEEFSRIFREAVRGRLVSDVPIGAFLSGGVDSSAVVEAMARLSSRPVVTTSIGFREQAFNELEHARTVAQVVGSEHHEVIVEARAAEVLPRLVWHLDEPFADSSALPTYYLAKAARERVTVALSGDGGDEVFDDFSRHFERTRDLDPLSRLLYVDLKTWLANDMLVKVDRMSMANGLEIRSPLLDQRVIEFAATVPSGLKYRGRTSKYLLKRYLETRVPRSVIYRPKQGFEIPLAGWLRGELRGMADDLLFSPRSLARGYVQADHLRQLWERHQRGIRNHAPEIWSLIMLELWSRTFMDQSQAQGPLAA